MTKPKKVDRRLTANKRNFPLPARTLKLLDRMEHMKINGLRLPTTQQMLFTRALFKTGSIAKAYAAADYTEITHTNMRKVYSNRAAKLNSVGVQMMVKLVVADWCSENQITANTLASMTLDAYNNATNVRDQLNALKLLATFVGCGKSLSLEN